MTQYDNSQAGNDSDRVRWANHSLSISQEPDINVGHKPQNGPRSFESFPGWGIIIVTVRQRRTVAGRFSIIANIPPVVDELCIDPDANPKEETENAVAMRNWKSISQSSMEETS